MAETSDEEVLEMEEVDYLDTIKGNRVLYFETREANFRPNRQLLVLRDFLGTFPCIFCF